MNDGNLPEWNTPGRSEARTTDLRPCAFLENSQPPGNRLRLQTTRLSTALGRAAALRLLLRGEGWNP